jgi:hypothetical protein
MLMKISVLRDIRIDAAPIRMTPEPGTFEQFWALAVYPQCEGPHGCPKAQKNSLHCWNDVAMEDRMYYGKLGATTSRASGKLQHRLSGKTIRHRAEIQQSIGDGL